MLGSPGYKVGKYVAFLQYMNVKASHDLRMMYIYSNMYLD